MWFANIFSHSMDCRFTLLIVLWCIELFIFDVLQFISFFLCCLYFGVIEAVITKSSVSEAFSLYFILGVLVLGLTFKFLIRFELIFVRGVGYGSSFILHVDI